MTAGTGTTGSTLNARWLAYTFGEWAARATYWFVGGSLLSLCGFLLPWFKWGERAEWSYDAWQLWRSAGIPWVPIVLLGYVVLTLAGWWLLGRGPLGAAGVAALAIAVALGTLTIFSLGAADGVRDVRRLERPVWGLGLLLLIPGHAVTIVAAFARLVLRLFEEILSPG